MLKLLFYGFFGWLVYEKYFKEKNSFLDSNILVSPDINPNLLSQPSQKFPVTNKLDKRVDNANQPWYVATNTFKGMKSDLKDLTGFDITNVQTSTYDVSGFWRDLNNRYGVH